MHCLIYLLVHIMYNYYNIYTYLYVGVGEERRERGGGWIVWSNSNELIHRNAEIAIIDILSCLMQWTVAPAFSTP